MIANARIQTFRRTRTHQAQQADMQQNTISAGSDLWNVLFQGSLLSQLARLSFHGSDDCEVVTIAALDLRPEGWIVIGWRCGGSEPIERPIDTIRDVEILDGPADGREIEITLPPMA